MILGARIYTLFPLLIGPVSAWCGELPQISRMGFNWVHLPPVHRPGASGHLHAVRDFRRLHPLFEDDDTGLVAHLSAFTAEARRHRLRVMLELCLADLAADSPRVTEHPVWFGPHGPKPLVTPDPDHPGLLHTWDDRAALSYVDPVVAAELIDRWISLAQGFAALGICGFRCSHAAQVPVPVWAKVIAGVRARYPDMVFLADCPGAGLGLQRSLVETGFDAVTLPLHWWDLHDDAVWRRCEDERQLAPAVASPERFDGQRLAQAMPDGADPRAYYRLRAMIAATGAAAWSIPMGFEWGFQHRHDPVRTRPDHREVSKFDLTGFVAGLNRLKAETPALRLEGPQWRLDEPGQPMLGILRLTPKLDEAVLVLANRSWDREVSVDVACMLAQADMAPERFEDVTPGGHERGAPTGLVLSPGECCLYRTMVALPLCAAGPLARAETLSGVKS